MPEGELPEGEFPEGELPEGELPEAELPEGELPEGELPEGELPEGELPEGELPEGEFPEGELPEGELPEGELPEGELPEGELPEGELPEGEEVSIPRAWAFILSLEQGLNMVSLALKPEVPLTAASFSEVLDATIVIRYDTDQNQFTSYIPDLAERTGQEAYPIEGGMGYIVNVLEEKALELMGQPWGEPVFEAPPLGNPNPDTPSFASGGVLGSVWAFVVSGLLEDQDGVGAQPNMVIVKNLRSGVTKATTPENGTFEALFVDLSRSPVVLPGDSMEVVALDANGKRVSGPFRWEVQPHHLRVAYLQTQMCIGDIIPHRTRLLANYPNPFNPETWMPYELAEAAPVTLYIYDVSGKLVRHLQLGHKPAGVYLDKSRAIYWDGRNDAGERVGSGIYFYRFQTDGFTAMRKMVVLK